MFTVAIESLLIDMVYGPTVCDAVWFAASDLTSGAKVFTVIKVKRRNEKPTKILQKIF